MVRTVAPWNEIMPPLAARERGKCGAPGDSGCAENRCDLDAGKAMNDQAKRMTPLARMLATLNDPHPQPLPTRGRGVHRTCRSHRLYLIGTRASLAATPESVAALKEKFGDAVVKRLGIEPEALTRPEAAYLLRFRDEIGRA